MDLKYTLTPDELREAIGEWIDNGHNGSPPKPIDVKFEVKVSTPINEIHPVDSLVIHVYMKGVER